MTKVMIVGCGDIGRRVISRLIESNHSRSNILACVRTEASSIKHQDSGFATMLLDLDEPIDFLGSEIARGVNGAKLIYLVPPSRQAKQTAIQDGRSANLINAMSRQGARPGSVVLLSTTAVYGDHQGGWVNEETPVNPQTDRGRRRLDLERRWATWCAEKKINLTVLRVAGIYAKSRIPRVRLERGTPVVFTKECGFTNRIHADDLAHAIVAALGTDSAFDIINVTDGTPGTISEFLGEAAAQINLPPLPQISLAQAKQELSSGMLSYLLESRKIGNEKMLKTLKMTLSHPDFRSGLRH